MKLETETLEAWVKSYETKGKLPESKIPCSTDECQILTTMFGTNLITRVIKFGHIRNLLTTFECKDCRSRSKMQALIAKLTKS